MASDGDVDITVKINDEFTGTLERLEEQIDRLESIVEVILNVDDSDIDKVQARLQALDGKETDSTHIVNYREDGDVEGPPKPDGSGITLPTTPDFIAGDGQPTPETAPPKQSPTPVNLPVVHPTANKPPVPRDKLEAATSAGSILKDKESVIRQRNGTRVVGGSRDGDRITDGVKRILGKGKEAASGATEALDSLDGKLKGLMPTMHKWMQLVAAILPMMIALGTAAAGVAASFGAVAAAGGAMVGLGLMGFENKTKRIKQFKQELKDVFSGTFNAFQPIADSILSDLPGMLSEIARQLRGLTVFRSSFMKGLRTVIDGVETLIERMIALEPIITQLTNRFLGMVTSGIIQFMTWLVREAYRNQDAMVGLASILANVLAVIYNLSTAVSEVVLEFRPLFEILVIISELLNSDIITGIVATVGKIFLMVKAIKAAVAAWNALTAAMARNPLGLLAVGASALLASGFGLTDTSDNGFGKSGRHAASAPVSGGGDNYYVMNVDGDVTDKHLNKFQTISTQTHDYQTNKKQLRDR